MTDLYATTRAKNLSAKPCPQETELLINTVISKVQTLTSSS